MEPDVLTELLNPSVHRREEFVCESEPLTDYIRTKARKDMDSGMAVCYVLRKRDEPKKIVGYFTLSASGVQREIYPTELLKGLPRYNSYPAVLVGRLARAGEFRGQGIGETLLIDALKRSFLVGREIGIATVVTRPKDEKAAGFYSSFGFLWTSSELMILPMTKISKLVGSF